MSVVAIVLAAAIVTWLVVRILRKRSRDFPEIHEDMRNGEQRHITRSLEEGFEEPDNQEPEV